MHVVLVEPEIPPNTGNIARTCAATGTVLHLVEPLGFQITDRHLRRAGVDYWHLVEVHVHPAWEALPDALRRPDRLHLFTSHGGLRYDQVQYDRDAVLVFGRESTGLPARILDAYPDRWRQIPMRRAVRSLNLSNAAALAVYEAWRQQGFYGADRIGDEG
jgi:tRNA (cytidine/uridine-2'-O-)-methyltransferase